MELQELGVLRILALASAGVAAALLISFLVTRPRIHNATRLWLALAIGVLPLGAALLGNLAGFEATKSREFCSSCHVMVPYAADAADPESESLAALHSRNGAFGDESCYVCHRDYEMFGAVTTKIGGMHHLWGFLTQYDGKGGDPADIELRKPYSALAICARCHSTELPGWRDEESHQLMADEIASGEVSCADAECHGPAHPVRQRLEARR